MLAKIEFHEINSRNLVGGTSDWWDQFWIMCLGLRIALGLMQLTLNNSLGVLSCVSHLAKRCMYLNHRYVWLLYFTSMAIL
jgi:hypothetical protein